MNVGREVATGRKVAIKKIKVGQFKDGLDMSAIREVKYLRELRHQNVIEVRTAMHSLIIHIEHCDPAASRRFLFKDKPQSCPRVPRLRPRNDYQGQVSRFSTCGYQKLDGYDIPWPRVLPS